MTKIELKKLEKKNRITNSAVKLFNERGFSNTRIEDIIADAKVGKGTFYLYYKNKEQLVEKVLEDLAGELMSILQWVQDQKLENRSKDELMKIFREEGVRLTDALAKNKEIAVFLNKHARSVSIEVDNMIQEFMDSLLDFCSMSFEEGIQKGELSQNLNPKITAACVIGGISFTYAQWACGHVNMDVELVLEALLAFFFNALGLKD